jgi:ankyrin repeat protein
MLEFLVAQGFEIEDIGNAAAPALFIAASENRMDNVAWLVDHGANVNATDARGVPLLTHALVCHDQKLVDYLVAAGAKPNEKTREVAARLGLSVGD